MLHTQCKRILRCFCLPLLEQTTVVKSLNMLIQEVAYAMYDTNKQCVDHQDIPT